MQRFVASSSRPPNGGSARGGSWRRQTGGQARTGGRSASVRHRGGRRDKWRRPGTRKSWRFQRGTAAHRIRHRSSKFRTPRPKAASWLSCTAVRHTLAGVPWACAEGTGAHELQPNSGHLAVHVQAPPKACGPSVKAVERPGSGLHAPRPSGVQTHAAPPQSRAAAGLVHADRARPVVGRPPARAAPPRRPGSTGGDHMGISRSTSAAQHQGPRRPARVRASAA